MQGAERLRWRICRKLSQLLPEHECSHSKCWNTVSPNRWQSANPRRAAPRHPRRLCDYSTPIRAGNPTRATRPKPPVAARSVNVCNAYLDSTLIQIAGPNGRINNKILTHCVTPPTRSDGLGGLSQAAREPECIDKCWQICQYIRRSSDDTNTTSNFLDQGGAQRVRGLPASGATRWLARAGRGRRRQQG